MRKVKKAVSALLAAAMLLCCCGFSRSDGSLSVVTGTNALNSQFTDGIGPMTEGYQLDYVYYEPSGTAGSCPLVIWLHGMSHGCYPRQQIEKNDISNWSSKEYQSRFEGSGGAYILCPRCPEDEGLYWWNDSGEDLTGVLMATITDFVAKHPNIDTKRIYIGGFSMGGNMTVQMCMKYPDYFAAAMLVCPAVGRGYDTSIMKDIPVWIVSSYKDPLVPYKAIVAPFWRELMKNSRVKGLCRFSTLGTVVRSDGVSAGSDHRAWVAVTADMFTDAGDGYYNMTTVNGFGKKTELKAGEGMIAWLSSMRLK